MLRNWAKTALLLIPCPIRLIAISKACWCLPPAAAGAAILSAVFLGMKG